ncbi:MAG: glycosyltransferase family 39 protein [Anaerolineae bacterium]|nr:glycosyltransferase family 39 protein [Anaerolineae bacterium]MDW8071623.1 glycosyltransferase family 39 protein [Anaerolineae bacterium]
MRIEVGHPEPREHIILAGVFAVAFVLRLINLSERPLWYDEAFAVLYAEKSFATMLHGTLASTHGVAADVHPLLYYILLHGWMQLFGQSPVAVRALSVLLGGATVVVAYGLGHLLYGRRGALGAALGVACAPLAVYYSQETRMYALLGVAALTMTYFFVRAWLRSGWVNWVAVALCGALVLYAHNLGFAFILGLDAWVVWEWFRPNGARWRNGWPLALSHFLMLALFAPWLMALPGQFGKVQQAYWVTQPGLLQLVQTLFIFHFAYDNQALPAWLLPPALFFSLLLVALCALALWRRRRALWASDSPSWDMLLVALAGTPVVTLFVISQWIPVYVVRALLPSALAYYVLLAGLWTRDAWPQPVRWGMLLPCALIVAVSLWNHYSYTGFPRAPFARVAAFLRAHHQLGDVIVHSNKLSFFPTHYYDRVLPQSFIADPPGSPSDTLAYPTQAALGLFAIPDIATAVQGHKRVWLVIFRRAVEEYQAAGYLDHPHRLWLEQRYSLVSLRTFGDLDVAEYRLRILPLVRAP